MREKLFLHGWSFLKTKLGTDVAEIEARKGEFLEVSLPHDWLIYDTKNLYENSIGWYRRMLHTEELKKEYAYVDGEHVYLCFDGVYMDSTLYVNGKETFSWKYGYSAFHVDISPYLTEEENELLVKVVHQSPNSRWYSGAGIYRDVTLRVAPEKEHLDYNGTYVHTQPEEDENYAIMLSTNVCSQEKPLCKIRYTLLDQNAEEVFCVYVEPWKQIKEGLFVGKTMMWVEKPMIWDVDDPNLYRLLVDLVDEQGQVMEQDELKIGFKTMEFHPDKGFLLNGKVRKIHGVCEHHDFGALGSVFYEDALRRKFKKLRAMGVNAIRSSHNMPAKRLMEIADEEGMLVVSEAFDMWERPKTEYDYARFFGEWHEKDVESWICRDRNHASLMMWSIGNEIYDTHAGERGQEITRMLLNLVREHDKLGNAPVTIGSNYMPWENAQKCADILKLAGYNYGEKCYDEHHKEHPEWVIYGSETASVVHSRGVYHFPYEQAILSDEDEQCSALGNSTTSWGARSVEKCIADDRDRSFAFGQFLWTGFDYIGEPTPYHTKNSYFGQLDTAGFPKDAYYIYQSQWGDAKTPMIHVFPYWDFNEGQLIDVRICSNAPEVELFLNGESMGKKELRHDKGTDFTAHFKVPYTAGELCAVAYDANGNELARESRHSFKDAVKIVAEADKSVLMAGTRQLSFVEISVLDENGYPVENAMNYLQVTTEGPIRLLGLDNGDSTDYNPYKCNVRKLFNGKLLAIVTADMQSNVPTDKTDEQGTEPAKAAIIISGKGLESARIEYEILPYMQGSEKGLPDDLNGYRYEEPQFEYRQLPDSKPVRKIELTSKQGQLISPENPELIVIAKVYPEDATDKEVIFKAVNDAGIEVDYVILERVDIGASEEENDSTRKHNAVTGVKVKALGDGTFKIRAMSKSGTSKVKQISQLELEAKGFGPAYLNPYGFVTGGLYKHAYGEITSGNEKGFATARGEESGVRFDNIDFGAIGSDVMTMPVFALSGAPYAFQIWEGEPGGDEQNLLLDGVYQKPSKWNVYQEETYTLKRRVRGITSLSFVFHDKVHMKGFSFKKYEKAYEMLPVATCDKVYGDSFDVQGDCVCNIGNNVTLVFEDMDFGADGAKGISIGGRSNLAVNTIHIHFIDEAGNDKVQVVEYKKSSEFAEQSFDLDVIRGKHRVEFVFLPGSEFDFASLRFLRNKNEIRD